MADTKITSLTGLASVASNDVIPIVDVSDTTQSLNGTTKKVTATDLLNISLFSGTLPVASGGTGATSLTSGNFLQGNGTSAVTATKAAPSGAVVGTTDTQTLTNKDLSAATNSFPTTLVTTNTTQTISGAKTFSTAPLFTFGTEAAGDTFYGAADGTITRLPKGTDGQVLTLASGVPAWGSSGSAGTQRVRAYRSANQSINNTTETAIQWNNESYDTDTMHDNSSNNTRITFTTAGVYQIGCHFGWDTNSTGRRYGTIRLNGTTNIAWNEKTAVGGSGVGTHELITEYSFSATDYIEVMAYQASGGALNVYADGTVPCVVWAHRIG